MEQERRVNIISLEIRDDAGKVIQKSGLIMRVTRSYADKAISAGTHETTSKGKLKSYLNKSRKLLRNKKYVTRVGGATGNINTAHKEYAVVPTLDRNGKPSGVAYSSQMWLVANYLRR